MKRKLAIVLLGLVFSVCVTACGNKDNSPEQTASNNIETSEIVETEDITSEIVEPTEVQEVETEVTETEIEETEVTTEEIIESTEIAPVGYEDFNVNNVTGYSNYIDEYGTGRHDFRVVICDVNSPDTLCDNVHNQTSYRGIALGDSREQVVEKYGEPHGEVVYKNKRWNHDGLEAQYNMNYAYIDERYPEVFFCLSFNMDQNDNVLSVYYEAILMKWY